jgi:site-specific recombinase XerD
MNTVSNEPKKKLKHPKSKKHVIKKLGIGWMNHMFKIQSDTTALQPAVNRGNCLLAIAIAMSTGLRPEELQKGVVLGLSKEGFIEITIQGAKIIKNEFGDVERGIELRVITLNPDYSEAAKYLQNYIPQHLRERGLTKINFSYRKSTLAKVVSTLGQKYLQLHQPKLTELKISPYVFRHQFASSLKSCTELNDIERAQCLGHLSTQSMQRYAKSFRTKSRVRPIVAVSTSAIPRQVQTYFSDAGTSSISSKVEITKLIVKPSTRLMPSM